MDSSRNVLISLSVPVWLIMILHVATTAGVLRVPLLILMGTGMIIGLISEQKEVNHQQQEGTYPSRKSMFESALRSIMGDTCLESPKIDNKPQMLMAESERPTLAVETIGVKLSNPDGLLGHKILALRSKLGNWIRDRKEVLMPIWLQGAARLVLKGDQNVHQKSMYLVKTSSNLLNSTLHPEIANWLPNSEDLQHAMDSIVRNAYLFDRNWIAAKVIFLTSMCYLLASSGDQYKPIKWFSTMSPTTGGNTFGQAVQDDVGGVFMASFKMAAFYGLFTWLTHSLFGVNVVFIPFALSAIFGAIPFVGAYLVAIQAVLELWLVKDQFIMAMLLLVIHILPSYVVDTAIYSEIKGDHPYMTGLAIAGGMYWIGLEGAIFGPIILCCIIVLIKIYGTMIKPDSPCYVR